MIETMELELVQYNHYNKYAIQIIDFIIIQNNSNEAESFYERTTAHIDNERPSSNGQKRSKYFFKRTVLYSKSMYKTQNQPSQLEFTSILPTEANNC